MCMYAYGLVHSCNVLAYILFKERPPQHSAKCPDKELFEPGLLFWFGECNHTNFRERWLEMGFGATYSCAYTPKIGPK